MPLNLNRYVLRTKSDETGGEGTKALVGENRDTEGAGRGCSRSLAVGRTFLSSGKTVLDFVRQKL
jgi:hypothetical protein